MIFPIWGFGIYIFFFRSVVVNAIKRHFNDVLLPLMDVCVVSLCS